MVASPPPIPWPVKLLYRVTLIRRVTAIIKGRQGITAVTALRLVKCFGTPPEYWLNLQHMHDLAVAMEGQHQALERIQPLPAA